MSEALSKALVLGASGSGTRSTHFCWAVMAESELEGYMLGRPVQGLETDQALLPLSHGVEPLSADGRPSQLVLATAGPEEQEHPWVSRAGTLTAQKAAPGHLRSSQCPGCLPGPGQHGDLPRVSF